MDLPAGREEYVSEQQEFMTLDEVAAYLRVSRTTVKRMVYGRELAASRHRHRVCVPRHDVDRYIAEHLIPALPALPDASDDERRTA
jgi:excisionase family DNA binding protein